MKLSIRVSLIAIVLISVTSLFFGACRKSSSSPDYYAQMAKKRVWTYTHYYSRYDHYFHTSSSGSETHDDSSITITPIGKGSVTVMVYAIPNTYSLSVDNEYELFYSGLTSNREEFIFYKNDNSMRYYREEYTGGHDNFDSYTYTSKN